MDYTVDYTVDYMVNFTVDYTVDYMMDYKVEYIVDYTAEYTVGYTVDYTVDYTSSGDNCLCRFLHHRCNLCSLAFGGLHRDVIRKKKLCRVSHVSCRIPVCWKQVKAVIKT